ncbi:hypothetical protein ACFQ3K_03360 [Brucella gallinifaecis]|uniref:Uncharacterized protein n=1 Tax=Brucella gallinifaecis TaxID=215590 RepID=A0A502BNI1_9HYPH|nr:hypothetical protein [Brucella gallinifaecis]TPF75201.1 hypothetical protein FHY56_10820 [Brucella gallinifaecis]
MTETTATQPAQPQRVQISPIAMANEARAMNDFLTEQSLRNANDKVLLMMKIKEMELAAEEQSKIHKEEMTRITQERDQVMQMYEGACQKIKDIQSDAMNVQHQLNEAQAEIAALKTPPVVKRRVKSNG